ncbi:MAG: DUF1540 domain-containing protein [Veillonellales bacterium]
MSEIEGGEIMALQNVKCKVSSCKFWQQGERCDASAIEVSTDGDGNSAYTSDQTNCHTFTSKNK